MGSSSVAVVATDERVKRERDMPIVTTGPLPVGVLTHSGRLEVEATLRPGAKVRKVAPLRTFGDVIVSLEASEDGASWYVFAVRLSDLETATREPARAPESYIATDGARVVRATCPKCGHMAWTTRPGIGRCILCR